MSISGVISETIDVTPTIYMLFNCIYVLHQISFLFWRLFIMTLSWHPTVQHSEPSNDYLSVS